MTDLATQLFTVQSLEILGGLLALGYLLRLSVIPNKFIGWIVTAVSIGFSIGLLKLGWLEGTLRGLIFAGLSSLSYEQAIKWVQDWVAARAPRASVIVAAALIPGLLLVTGCTPVTIQIPTTYVDASGNTVSYTKTEQSILKACATIESNLSQIRVGISLTTQGAITLAIKDNADQETVGAQCWTIASGVFSLTGNASLPEPSLIATTVEQFSSNVKDVNLAKQVASIAQNLQSTYASIYNQLKTYQSQTTNKNVLATITKTGLDLLAAIAGGVQDGTSQWKPSTSN